MLHLDALLQLGLHLKGAYGDRGGGGIPRLGDKKSVDKGQNPED